MKIKIITVALSLLLLIFLQPLIATTKVFLLISEQFPQIPLKPLTFLTNQPKHQIVRLDGIVADLFLPNYIGSRPALIIAMGVRTNEKDKPVLLGFADTLSRLGFVVMWPRLEDLDTEQIKYEKPQTFVDSLQYLERKREVDPKKISFVGFSVGSSVSMVAAEDPSINSKVRSFIFFGGYYNVIDYLTSLATGSYLLNGAEHAWRPDQSGINYASGILEKEGLELDFFANDSEYDRLDYQTKLKLLQLSPDQQLNNFITPIFILHEKQDRFVPYVESIKLNEALVDRGVKPRAFHIANLFEHVQPKKGFSLEIIKEFFGLFVFLHKVFMFI